jgi:uncharacterized protein (DUF2249 family)
MGLAWKRVDVMTAAIASGLEISLDVRPLLAAGQEPFSVIMETVSRVEPGGVLILDAPFDPAPLRRMLGSKGFTCDMEQLADRHFRVRFTREVAAVSAAVPAVSVDDTGAKIWRDSDGIHIDVRGLAAPNPMTAILRLIEQPDCGAVVVVHHEREPVFLFPELAQRGWSWEAIPADAPEFRFRLTRG